MQESNTRRLRLWLFIILYTLINIFAYNELFSSPFTCNLANVIELAMDDSVTI